MVKTIIILSLVVPIIPFIHTRATEEFRFQSQYGTPTIDGTIRPGEWIEWTEIVMELDSGPGPESTLDTSFAVMNTGYHLYLGLQIPNQLPANWTISEAPRHWNRLSLRMEDGVNKTMIGGNQVYRLIDYAINIESDAPDFPPEDPTAGGYPMAETDPSRPRSAYSFTETNGPLGTYVFEIVFPFTTMQPTLLLSEEVMYGGLRPVPLYRIWHLDWSVIGTLQYSYRFPPYLSEWYIDAAFDPTPLIHIVVIAAIVVIVLLVVVRWIGGRRRARASELKESPHSR